MNKKALIEKIRSKTGFICDMDGVIYHGNKILDGVKEFVEWLKDENKRFVFLTNSSERTIKELRAEVPTSLERQAYFVGKPNPLMMRIALKKIGVQREGAIIIGDRMDTDIVAGIEAEIDTCLVLTGISDEKTIDEYAYRPHFILKGVHEIVKDFK